MIIHFDNYIFDKSRENKEEALRNLEKFIINE